MDIYERISKGAEIDTQNDQEYKEILVKEMVRSRTICFKINSLLPYDEKIRLYLDELFENRLPKSSTILSPMYIDRGKTLFIGKDVFINWNFNCISTGGITIEDGVMIAPNVSLITANHKLNDLKTIYCKGIRICKNAWIGEGVRILPGVTIGENAVVGAGSVVTHDVAANSIVAGNPAHFIKFK